MSLILTAAAVAALTVLAYAYWDRIKQWIEKYLSKEIRKYNHIPL